MVEVWTVSLIIWPMLFLPTPVPAKASSTIPGVQTDPGFIALGFGSRFLITS